jgi:hypothetical protein
MAKRQPYENATIHSKKHIIINNFLGGIAWSLGATVGISVIFTILGIIAQNVNFVPIVGSFVSNIINFILSTNPNFHK